MLNVKTLKDSKNNTLVAVLIFIGAFLRFYNLNWGAPFYFHPDERNIADLVLRSNLASPTSLLKGTFAYGNFPVILMLLLKSLFLSFFQIFKITDPLAQTTIILRITSASFSVLTLYVIFLCGKFWSKKVALLSLFLATFSTGFIQQAHFGTYDGFMAFCSVTVFYFLLRFIKSKRILFYYLAILFIALGAAAKINLLVLSIFPIAILLSKLKTGKTHFIYVFKNGLFGLILLLCLTALLSPYYLTLDFRNSLAYERGLVAGTAPVFYTQSFYNTTPVIFQLLHILPFLINPLLTIILLPAFSYVLFKTIKARDQSFLLLASCFLLLFLPQAFLFAKWTRYIVPALPFIYLLISISILDLLRHFKKILNINYLVFSILIFSSVAFSLSYFITVFVRPDTRVEASTFAKDNIQANSRILSEPYDLGIMSFNDLSHNIIFFNFYDLETGKNALQNELKTDIEASDYIILPSQRLIRSRSLNKNEFPKGYDFYSSLQNGRLGYLKIYETPCDIFCKITYLNNPVFGFEETATVFDRPTVFIFKKTL